MPTSVDDFIEQMELLETDQQASHIKKICESYKPNLAMGNKEKMNQFVSILLSTLCI